MFDNRDLIVWNSFDWFSEKLTLQVPWKNLYTHPTKATIDGLFLLVVPKTGWIICWIIFSFESKIFLLEIQYDAQRDEKEQHEAKMKEVRKVEDLRKEKESQSNSHMSFDNSNEFLSKTRKAQIKTTILLPNECNYKWFEIWNYPFEIFTSSMKINRRNLIIHLHLELLSITFHSMFEDDCCFSKIIWKIFPL